MLSQTVPGQIITLDQDCQQAISKIWRMGHLKLTMTCLMTRLTAQERLYLISNGSAARGQADWIEDRQTQMSRKH